MQNEGTVVSDHDNENDCRICSSGMYTELSASSGCSVCKAGTFLVDNAAAATAHDSENDCTTCGSGKYSSSKAASCTSCVKGKHLEDAGTSADFHNSESKCKICVAGKYSPAAAATCTLPGAEPAQPGDAQVQVRARPACPAPQDPC